MDTVNIIAVIIFVGVIGIIAGISIYKAKKNNKDLTFEDFIAIYGDQIIAILQDVIVLLRIESEDFATREEYEKKIISTTIDKIKENGVEFGFDITIMEIIDTDFLTEAIHSILSKNAVEIFSILNYEEISEKSELYSEEVIKAAKEAEEDAVLIEE